MKTHKRQSSLSPTQRSALAALSEANKADKGSASYVYYWADAKYHLISNHKNYDISYSSRTIKSLEGRRLLRHVYNVGYVAD